ncbi:MAG: GatB/YqeY domain-containing protein [bacterium]|nr:GatB/YqeY domain-containing protein [bacterium]
MSISENIDTDLKQALKNKEELKLSVLRMLKTALKNAEIAAKGILSDEDAMKVLNTQAKQRKDAIEQFTKGDRSDLADKEKAELEIIEAYLPEKMGEDEIRKIVQAKIDEAGNDLNFGKIMGTVMKDVGQGADGQLVRTVLTEEIEKKNG